VAARGTRDEEFRRLVEGIAARLRPE